VAEYDSVIPPGGSGKLVAKVKTKATQKGKISKMIRVTTDDPGARSLVLRLEAEIVAAVEVYPRRRVYFGVIEGESSENRVVLRRRDGKPLTVKNAKVRDPSLVTVSWEPVSREGQVAGYATRPGDVVVTLRNAERIRGSSRSTVVELSTDVPDEPVVELPVSIRVRPRIQVSPPQVHLILPPEGGAGTVRMVRLTGTSGKPFRILGIDNDRPGDLVVEFDGTRSSTQHTMTLRVTDAAAGKKLDLSLRGALVVRTDEPGASEIKVPFVIQRRRPTTARPRGTIEPLRHTPVPTPPGGRQLKAPPLRQGPVGTPVRTEPTPGSR